MYTDLGVVPQTQLVYLEVAPQALIAVDPQAEIDLLEVGKREPSLTSYKCLLLPVVHYHCFQLITFDR